jgi:hypothetical protein
MAGQSIVLADVTKVLTSDESQGEGGFGQVVKARHRIEVSNLTEQNWILLITLFHLAEAILRYQ